jgi:hypothetical protein
MEGRLAVTIRDARRFFEKLGKLKPDAREKEMAGYRQKAQEELAAFLEKTLQGKQAERLRQIELQQEGLFALGRPEVGKQLKLSDEQRERFAEVVAELQTKVQATIESAQKGKSDPQEVRPKVMKLRKQYEAKVEAILDDGQKKRWKAMLGKPLELDD